MAAAADRAERLTNLLALLLESRVPLTADDIFDELGAQYPSNLSGRRQAFERDKATLRGMGVPIDVEVLGGEDAGRTAYSIDRAKYELDQLDLDTDETQALQVAVAAIRSGTPVGTDALIKLGVGAADIDVAVSASVPTLDALPTLREAIARRHSVAFTYHDRPRRLDPYGLLLRSGFWYVVGHDHGHSETRTFRVDRIDGDVEMVPGTSFERPDVNVAAMFPADPKQLAESPDASEATAIVRIWGPRTRSIERELGSDRVVARRDDGSVDVRVPCANVLAFRSWLLELLEMAEVLEPASVRDDVVSWLRDIVGDPLRVDRSTAGEMIEAVEAAVALESPASAGGSRSHPGGDRRHPGRPSPSRRSAEERVHRMLLMLPWLTERTEVTVDEVARRFQTTPKEIEADITWVSMCGLPPFVDEMIDVFIDEGTVHVGVPRLFTRPLKLTAPEGFALLAAGRAAMALPGADPAGPLGRGLKKLADALGDDERGLVLELDQPDNAEPLADAVRRIERVEIEYWSPARDEVTARTVTPRRMFTDRGHWYLAAADHSVGAQRTFRLDRIESVRRLGVYDEPPGDGVDPRLGDEQGDGEAMAWFSDGAIPRATLLLLPPAFWVAERYPVDALVDTTVAASPGHRSGAARIVRLAVSSERWLERLMVRLGTDAAVLDPVHWQTIGADAARRVLVRYTR